MTGFVPKEKLTAYQRWEVAAFDEAEQAAAHAAKAAKAMPAPPPEDSPPAVTLPTAADIERIHIEAHQQGYEAGLAEGHAEAQSAAQAIADQFATLLDNLPAALKDIDQQVAEQLLATAVEIASQIVRQTLRLKPELILPVVREAVSSLNVHGGHPALFAHPDDARLIRQHIGEQLSHNNWRIIEDAGLTPGGCRVELGASEVDATIETRWRRVIESMGMTSEWLADKP